jgi:hypothetical protein
VYSGSMHAHGLSTRWRCQYTHWLEVSVPPYGCVDTRWRCQYLCMVVPTQGGGVSTPQDGGVSTSVLVCGHQVDVSVPPYWCVDTRWRCQYLRIAGTYTGGGVSTPQDGGVSTSVLGCGHQVEVSVPPYCWYIHMLEVSVPPYGCMSPGGCVSTSVFRMGVCHQVDVSVPLYGWYRHRVEVSVPPYWCVDTRWMCQPTPLTYILCPTPRMRWWWWVGVSVHTHDTIRCSTCCGATGTCCTMQYLCMACCPCHASVVPLCQWSYGEAVVVCLCSSSTLRMHVRVQWYSTTVCVLHTMPYHAQVQYVVWCQCTTH